jgi:hypothetical protein
MGEEGIPAFVAEPRDAGVALRRGDVLPVVAEVRFAGVGVARLAGRDGEGVVAFDGNAALRLAALRSCSARRS